MEIEIEKWKWNKNDLRSRSEISKKNLENRDSRRSQRRPYQGHQHSTFCLSCQIILCPGSKNKRDEMIVQECLFLFSKNKCHDVKVFVGLYNWPSVVLLPWSQISRWVKVQKCQTFFGHKDIDVKSSEMLILQWQNIC